MERKTKTLARSVETFSKISTSVFVQSFSSAGDDGKNVTTVSCPCDYQLAWICGVDDDQTVSSMGWLGHHFTESVRGKNVAGEELSDLESAAVDVVDRSYLATSGDPEPLSYPLTPPLAFVTFSLPSFIPSDHALIPLTSAYLPSHSLTYPQLLLLKYSHLAELYLLA